VNPAGSSHRFRGPDIGPAKIAVDWQPGSEKRTKRPSTHPRNRDRAEAQQHFSRLVRLVLSWQSVVETEDGMQIRFVLSARTHPCCFHIVLRMVGPLLDSPVVNTTAVRRRPRLCLSGSATRCGHEGREQRAGRHDLGKTFRVRTEGPPGGNARLTVYDAPVDWGSNAQGRFAARRRKVGRVVLAGRDQSGVAVLEPRKRNRARARAIRSTRTTSTSSWGMSTVNPQRLFGGEVGFQNRLRLALQQGAHSDSRAERKSVGPRHHGGD